MTWLYRLNWWYDDRREPFRFLLFAMPCVLSWCMIVQDPLPAKAIGVALIGTLAIMRMIPMTFRRKRPPTDPCIRSTGSAASSAASD